MRINKHVSIAQEAGTMKKIALMAALLVLIAATVVGAAPYKAI